ncbi:Eco57I restriction-modification methylase domain-containing protein [Nitrosomonas eutropha]|uniref:Eco57I restriction-modification methylase n=2 Tax=Nitrosomonas eutropha TaxID=916 RepID=A0ABX5M783_9PROT|nr:Eco57I restriction-modification methylase domain-containing protein [Nitrosomonas eutropha]ABI59584.1 Eco57I restriction endonuclease [Nitrosomonas eutropha C91]PXV79801.1 Eco57I restriction-modification methylase [Nitrosomonas eutropha]SEJ25693.1 Eco57I restriction-modification methylase [Nitrosomonas eutropha]
MDALTIKPTAHVVDVLGNVIGRDQPILRMEKALEMVALLGEKVFTDENVIFFDPFCKAGELLLACAFHSCWAKAKGKAKLLDVDMVMKEIYQSNRYFGLASDERHHRLSIRTFLGNEHSHSENYNQIIRDGHYVSEEDGALDAQKFEREFNSMIEYINLKTKNKKIIAIGNPPYQESDGGFGASARLIYPYFIENIIDSKAVDEFILVVPSRWFSGGKNLDRFRKRMMTSNQIKTIRYFEKSEEVFPTVQIKGGVCYLQWSSSYNGKPQFNYGHSNTEIDLERFDVIPDDPESPSIILKVLDQSDEFVSSIAWSGKPFGLRTFYFKRNDSTQTENKNTIRCYSTGRAIYNIDRNLITKNKDKIDRYKVVAPRAYGKGMSRCTLPVDQIFLLGKGEISTETYNVIGCFETETEAQNFRIYLQTDFSRYLLGLRKLTQDIPKDRWNWVPLLDLEIEWTNERLAEYFHLTKREQEHIKKKVQEWS